MKVLAGIVLYNPDIKRLTDNVNGIIHQVDHIVMIDNCSNNIDKIKGAFDNHESISIIWNNDNKGIASALNQIFIYAIDNEFDWVITLDQDSVCQDNLISNYKKYIDDNVGMMTCIIEDRNAVFSEFQSDLQKGVEEVDRIITSGAFCSVKAYEKVGGFDNRLFIDWVDFDYCAKVKEAGYKLVRIPFKGLLHEIGTGKNVKLFGKDRVVLNESPLRVYYRTRNKIYVSRKYKKQYLKSFAIKSVLVDSIMIILYEKQKGKKIKALLKGARDVRQLKK